MTDQDFCYVISNKFYPYLLFDIFQFICMEVTQADCMFKFAEGSFDAPS